MNRDTPHAKSIPRHNRYFGHTCHAKPQSPVYYTASKLIDVGKQAMTCFRLPTVRALGTWPAGRSRQRGPMNRRQIPRLLALLPLLGVLLALSPQPPEPAPARLVPGFSKPWHWPLAGDVQVLRPFEGPAQNWLPGHRGVDLAARPALSVLAPQDGVVSFRGHVVDRPALVIDHGQGFKSSFEPVSSDLSVGDRVLSRQLVAELANGAHCSDRCLHWGVRLHGDYIDPALLIEDLRPSVLLPLD